MFAPRAAPSASAPAIGVADRTGTVTAQCCRVPSMSTDTKGKRFCDDCGRIITKAVRIDQGREYCQTCYKREFRPQTCSTCQTVSRHHRAHAGPYPCPACIRKKRRCTRCDKAVLKKAAMVLADGRCVCPSCAPYFRVPASCTTCGALSTRLARLPKYGAHDLICERCQAKLTNRTCSVCRRYRRVVGETADGKPYCAACEPARAETHLCSGCGSILAGSGNGRCRSCLTRTRILQAATLAASALQRDWNQWLLAEYAQWLAKTRADHTNILRHFHAHMAFFERLEASFTYLSDLTATSLLAQFPVAELRRYLLPISFLRERLGLVLTPEAKLEQVEGERITDILMESQREAWGPLITGYREWLTTQAVALRTTRLLLRSAERFCRTQAVTNDAAWKPTAILHFLTRFPGHRAGLYKFVTYVRSTRSWDVAMPKLGVRTKVPRTIPALATVMERITRRGVDHVPVAQLARALAKALGFTLAAFLQGTWQLQDELGSVVLTRGEERIVVPEVLVPVARAWVRRRG